MTADPSAAWRFRLDPFPTAPALTGGALDRADHLRAKPEKIAELLSEWSARALPIWRGKALIALSDVAPPSLAWRPIDASTLTPPPTGDRVFLGLENGAPRFAVDLSPLGDDDAPPLIAQAAKFIDLRSIAGELAPGDAAIIAEAKSLTDWHAAHRFCSRCGAASDSACGGWRRDCGACGGKHFPRTDPVVIMLVTRRGPGGEDRVVLGRQRNWPPGLYSLLAGYVEPGESIEEAVRRETWEEAGLRVGRVGYLASQPWPFPSTLMIGCYAEALSDALSPDFEELEDCRWVSRSEMAEALAGRHATLASPRRDAIAFTLLSAWAEGAFEAAL